MKNIYTVAHTHWDFEWYFTRQEARVQFIYHMDEVLEALATNQLDFYTLDGQMSILEDYLTACPEKKTTIKKFVEAGRLFIGPWFTQIDEMTTSGESIVRNLRIGLQEAEALGNAMRVGYLPDSFGQNQDMPKIYQGFDISYALFWRGMPKEANSRYFYWTSNDGSKVLTANIKNGYYAGVDLIEQDDFSALVNRITTDTNSAVHLLPVGGDQRAVDFQLKERIAEANQALADSCHFIESNYPTFFKSLESEAEGFTSFSGEFIEPSVSKIHRGIYSSRYDLKQIYDHLERLLTYQLEPLSVLAANYGIPVKPGLLTNLWKIVARGQAHDSAGGCNSDKTNHDIYTRGLNGVQEAQACIDYLLRKLSSSLNQDNDDQLFIWNPLPFEWTTVKTIELSTKRKNFALIDQDGQAIPFEILTQKRENAALLRRNPEAIADEHYYLSTIALSCKMPAMGLQQFKLVEAEATGRRLKKAEEIANDWYILQFKAGQFHLYVKETQQWYHNFLTFEDGGDEGDTYDYSPAFADWLLTLDFRDCAQVTIEQGEFFSRIAVSGSWHLPNDLAARKDKKRNGTLEYTLVLTLNSNNNLIDEKMEIDNQVLDHRLRLMLGTKTFAKSSTSDTPFGIINRPLDDTHLEDWRAFDYKEEPTSLRPLLHFANVHDEAASWSFLTKGTKDFQVVQRADQTLAITVFRGVGYLGRPDLLRRPGDASGLQTKSVPTPDSQLIGKIIFEGSLCVDRQFDAQKLQEKYLLTTQTGLYYQTQTVNRFTTAIQYFPINTCKLLPAKNECLAFEQLTAVFSSMQETIDQTGIEVRLYNPLERPLKVPGRLLLHQRATIKTMNLEGKIIGSVAANVKELAMEPFKPGEIRTYGIYFNQER